jgi:hypothetical protein
MAIKGRLTIVLALLASVTVLSWYLGTGGGGHPMAPNLGISAAVLFIALLKVRLIMREFMEVSLAPAWVRRSSYAWLGIFFSALFVVHYAVKALAGR